MHFKLRHIPTGLPVGRPVFVRTKTHPAMKNTRI